MPPPDPFSFFGTGGGSNKGWYEATNTTIGGAGVGTSVVQYGAGKATLGDNSRIYTSGWRGNQYVSTFKISNLAEKLASGLLVLSVGFDFTAWYQGDLSSQHLAANLGMDAVGVLGGPWGAAGAGIYYGLETFYPGGAAGAINNYDEQIQQNQAIDPNYLPMDPGKISFRPKSPSLGAIHSPKKPKKQDDVVGPDDLVIDTWKI